MTLEGLTPGTTFQASPVDSDAVTWPPPEVDPEDENLKPDLQKARHQSELQVVVDARKAALEIVKAHRASEAERAKAEGQLELDLRKAREQLELDLRKAREQSQFDQAKAHAAMLDDVSKAKQQSEIDIDKARKAFLNDLQKAVEVNDHAMALAVHNAYVEISKGTIDRTRARAEFVEKAAGGLGTAYTAILALTSFGANKSLPPQGIIPTVFFGAAVVLAAVYLAFISKDEHKTSSGGQEGGAHDWETKQLNRLNELTRWTSSIVRHRVSYLHAAVISLGLGVLFLPVAFLNWMGLIIGLIALVVGISVLQGLIRRARE